MNRAVVAALLFSLVAACRSTPSAVRDGMSARSAKAEGVVHAVEKGQTLWRIARAYSLTLQELAEVNDIEDPTQIRVGQKLWIPDAKKVLKIEPAGGVVEASPPPQSPGRPPPPATSGTTVALTKGRFIWPVKGTLYSRFGVRNGTRHDGIDISAPKGSTVIAADAGQVLYSGVQRGYGNIVLVKHADGLITIYAHNERNLVETGQRVKRAQPVAKVGQTGRASGPHLHFEVRKERIPRNPLFYLPTVNE